MNSVIVATVLFEKPFWIGTFERNDNSGYTVAKKIFGGEPTDAELYQFVLSNYHELNFSEPQKFKLIIKRKNPKRLLREVKKEMENLKKGLPKVSHAQETLKLELEKNKKERKKVSKLQKEELAERTFQLKQAKKKQKQRGH